MAWYYKMRLRMLARASETSAIMSTRFLLSSILLCLVALPAGAADKRVFAFGDSITIGHGDFGVLCPDNVGVAGYPPRLRSRLAGRGLDADLLNRGLCGERTGAGVTRIDGVLSEGGDVIIIMEGTNDVSARIGFETTVFNLNVMAQKAELADVEPVLAAIVPRGPESGTDENNGKTRLIGVETQMDAEQNGWAFADTFHPIFDQANFFELYYFDQLHPNGTGYNVVAGSMVDATLDAALRDELCAQVPPGPCVASGSVLCLNQGRFRLEARWKNFFGEEGMGRTLPQTDDTGAFYWVDPNNIEMTIKVLDGRLENNHFWVFYGALSNLEFTLAVADTQTGRCKEYLNPLGTFASVGDTAAFFELPP